MKRWKEKKEIQREMMEKRHISEEKKNKLDINKMDANINN